MVRSATHNLKNPRKLNVLRFAGLAIKTSFTLAAVVASVSRLTFLTTTKKIAIAAQIVVLARNTFLLARSARTRLQARRRCAAGSVVTVNVGATTQE